MYRIIIIFFGILHLSTTLSEALSCDWPTADGKLSPRVQNNPTQVVNNVNNIEDCRDQCIEESSFICAAVNYDGNTCELLTESNETARTVLTGGWQYSVRPICAGIWLPWKLGKASTSTAYLTPPASKLKDCMTECLRDVSKGPNCKSIGINSSSSFCNLFNSSASSASSTVHDSLYFNKPAWYLDTSAGASKANITWLSHVGSYLQLFPNKTIPVDGYLVGWKYYLIPDTVTVNGLCTSYVGVWRPMSVDKFQIISRTKLTQQTTQEGGVRFQFVQNEIFRVKAGDILSIFSKTGGGKCRNQVSSLHTAGQTGEIGYTLPMGELAIPIGKSITKPPNSVPRNPALKAYISEYLSLESAPTLFLNESLVSGQIWLTLPPPLTSEDAVVVAGYNIICSTSTDMLLAFNCSEGGGLVPPHSKRVLLRLPSVTSPYYAAVQIVRNNRGQPLIDLIDQPDASNPFCAGRTKVNDANLTESGNLTDTQSPVVLNITLLTSFDEGDYCAESLKLTYNLQSTDYQPVNETSFSVELKQGIEYDLRIYLKLTHGDDFLLWEGKYTTSAVPTAADSGGTMPMSPAAIIGGVMGALILVLIVSVVSILFVFKRRQSRSDRGLPEKSIENENNGTLMNLIESKAVSNIPPPIGISATPNPESTAAVKKHPTAAPNGAAILDENTYENSTRIAVESLQDLIRYEKEKFPEDPFKQEFLRLESAKLKCNEGRTPETTPKNRFKNITPFDENRVRLEVTSRHTSDYVNASYIKDFYNPDYYKFIAAQGPKEGTAVDMWRLIHDTRANTIVMLTNLIENGKKKCWQYWPSKVSESIEFEDYTVTLLEEQVYALYIVRKLSYTVNNITRQTTLFHYTKWYDHDIPSSAGLLSFRSRVRQHYGSSTTPIIVHCSAGVGRTGTYIALENLIDEAHDKRNHHKTVDVFACVNRLRHQRTLMVQTADQYAFLYDMVSEALSCGDTVIPAGNFSQQIRQWRVPNGKNSKTEISNQFEKLNKSLEVAPKSTSTAEQPENASLNRDLKALPSDRNRVIIQRPEKGYTDYINAVYCNGYQNKDGFVVTQTPLPSTTSNYWKMIIEQESRLIVYFNDCEDEAPYWPTEVGGVITVSDISIINMKTQGFAEAITETTLAVQVSRTEQKHRVTLLEVKLKGQQLPTSQQLVVACQKSEKFATSDGSKVTVQCRNGSRVSGIFIIAMNLYLRTRIEHDIDIVLEVKLAREGKIQFISSLEQFEALYDFVNHYLLEFNEYSNFAS